MPTFVDAAIPPDASRGSEYPRLHRRQDRRALGCDGHRPRRQALDRARWLNSTHRTHRGTRTAARRCAGAPQADHRHFPNQTRPRRTPRTRTYHVRRVCTHACSLHARARTQYRSSASAVGAKLRPAAATASMLSEPSCGHAHAAAQNVRFRRSYVAASSKRIRALAPPAGGSRTTPACSAARIGAASCGPAIARADGFGDAAASVWPSCGPAIARADGFGDAAASVWPSEVPKVFACARQRRTVSARRSAVTLCCAR